METENDTELLRRIAAGDDRAGQVLHKRYEQRMQQFVRWRMALLAPDLRRRLDPEDVVQESWLTVVAKADKYQGGDQFFLWVRRICHDQVITALRRHLAAKRDVNLEAHSLMEGDSSGVLVEHLVGSVTRPSSVARREELRQIVMSKIQQMDTKDREVLMLRHFEELSNGEVAELLTLSAQAASIRYRRALQRLGEIAADLEHWIE
ncbi:MAG: sigma-70 family RNA polymerase sigma factor [Planctomycetales bacterium]|nr:sigma-70 family RNA polymerase sigma factor [Planctomycetales bacterium]